MPFPRAAPNSLPAARGFRTIYFFRGPYFPSIDLDVLRRLLACRIRDDRFLRVVDRVLDLGCGMYDAPGVRRRAAIADDWPPPGRGLPIGAYTSQLFAAHVYLNRFDHFVKRELRVHGYSRYVDDIFCFGDRADLRTWRREIAAQPASRLAEVWIFGSDQAILPLIARPTRCSVALAGR